MSKCHELSSIFSLKTNEIEEIFFESDLDYIHYVQLI